MRWTRSQSREPLLAWKHAAAPTTAAGDGEIALVLLGVASAHGEQRRPSGTETHGTAHIVPVDAADVADEEGAGVSFGGAHQGPCSFVGAHGQVSSHPFDASAGQE